LLEREKTCCFTGHRCIPNGSLDNLKRQLKQEIEKLIQQGVIYFGTGGALGFDTLAAEAVLELKKKYPLIRLILVCPCPEQDRYWKEEDRKIYQKIKSRSDKVVYVSPHYTSDCMKKRNRHLVDYSGVCICYLRRRNSGTAYTVGYARQKGLVILEL
jgi:uncharacterized phage-like protein YoqJ